ncbi:MAG TPA: YetF domain-containing protein [Thermoanaerobaculia bacterium]|nr:YetF domain-containing protein [Thermoanaerobaculia bacterium]
MDTVWEGLRWALGVTVEPRSYNLLQVSLRAIVVYSWGLVILRIGLRRSLSRTGIFDIVLGIILGSVLSRAVNGSATLIPTLGGSAVLVALHRLLGFLAFHSHRFGNLIKGRAVLLLRDGKAIPEALRKNSITRRDVDEFLHLHGLLEARHAREVRLERNGEVSVVPYRNRGVAAGTRPPEQLPPPT